MARSAKDRAIVDAAEEIVRRIAGAAALIRDYVVCLLPSIG
jgi:hypothetical protein